jgi:L-proline amide hydrolase
MNAVIYREMQGASEFTIGGVLKGWSILDRLPLVLVPALVLVGEFDSMTEECAQAIVDRVPLAWPLVVVPRAGHCKLLDEPQLCIKEINRFLQTIELELEQVAASAKISL